jgi:putative PIN family toxin of toxin-antitoxin system
MLRVVIDTNVLVSSVLSKHGVPAQVVAAWQERKFLVVTSIFAMNEARNTLEELHKTGKYTIHQNKIDELMNLFHTTAKFVLSMPDLTGVVPADPDDEKILATAVGGEASIIISGDKHLLNLKEYQRITILTPRQFLRLLE